MLFIGFALLIAVGLALLISADSRRRASCRC
jgi:hypothetical protein